MSFRINSIGIPTRDRTGSLEACLLSYAKAARSDNTLPTFHILDNSPSPSVQATNGELLSTLARDHNLAIHHLDHAQRDSYSQQLARLFRHFGVNDSLCSVWRSPLRPLVWRLSEHTPPSRIRPPLFAGG